MRLLISRACRSDYPLSDPIIKKLRKEQWCHFQTIDLVPANFLESYKKCQNLFDNFEYDLVLCIGDRIEVLPLAICASLHHQKIMHLGAGIINQTISTFDDLFRHQITILSDIALCEDRKSYMTTYKLWETIGRNKLKDKNNIHIIGNPYDINLDEIDESLVPDEPYDLVLINPTTTIKEIPMFLSKENTIIIGSNADGRIPNLKPTYDNLPRPQFLGLLSKCQRFISNSSCTRYEAPMFLKPEQIVQIGARNKLRSSKFENMQAGASDRIIEILKQYWRNNQNE